MAADKPLIIALDYSRAEEALAMAGCLDPQRVRVKVGKELFTAAGPKLVRQLVERGFDVFLDLKFHDIPSTVAGAVRAAAGLGAWMINVHAGGGPRMLEAARNALEGQGAGRPLLTAVTVLTSMDERELKAVGIAESAEQQVLRLAKLARDAALDGVVCSAREAGRLRDECGPDFRLVTPGIRPEGSDRQDQQRVVTPADAVALGVDYLVVGRPVTAAEDPAAAVDAILGQL